MKQKIPNKIILLFITLFYNLTSLAHQGAIKGTISDSLSNEIIVGAIISISESNQVTSSDILGNFYFQDVHPGIYKLKISSLGFANKFYTIEVKKDETTKLFILLHAITTSLSEVTISENGQIGTPMLTLNKLDIDLRPIKSSQDILRMIPGLVTAQHAGGGKAEQIFLRGFDIDHGTDIKLTVDGMPVNMVSHAHGQGYADLHFLTPEIIENVDFNKGPYYSNQGNFTTAGYANFQTKNTLDKSSIKTEAGLFDSYRLVGLFNILGKEAKSKNQNAYIASEYVYTNGYFKSPQNFNRINIMGKYHGVIGDNKILTVSLSTFTSKWDASGQIPERAVSNHLINRFGSIDDKEGGQTSRSNINVMLTKLAKNGGIIKNQLYYVNYNFELFSNFTFYLNDSINGDQIKQAEKRNIYGYNNSYTKNNYIFNKKVKSEIGVQLRQDIIKNSEISHTANRKTLINPISLGQITESNAGVYLDETIYLTEKLIINAGIRLDVFQHEYINDLDTVYNKRVKSNQIISPKLNLFYNFTTNCQLYVKTGRGFHSNDTRVVVSNSSTLTTLPRALGMDIGLFFKPIKRMLINTVVWALDLEQEFVYVGDAAVVEPSGYTRRYGADLSVRYQLFNWLHLDFDGNYTVPRLLHASDGKNYIPLAPTLTSIGGITAKFKNGLNSGLRYRFVGDRPANSDNSVVAKGYGLLDGVVNFVKSKYAIGIIFENILNSNWNEAQFDTMSKLKTENKPVSELHFTPGTPFFIKGNVTLFF